MKNTYLILLFVLVISACSKGEKKDQKEQEKAEAKKYDLPYLKELEEQKSKLNEKVEFWTARALFVDSSEDLLDLDLDPSGKTLLFLTKKASNYFIYTLETSANASPRLVCKESRPLTWAKFNGSHHIIYSFLNEKGHHILNQKDLSQSIDQLPAQIQMTTNGHILSSHISVENDLALHISNEKNKTSSISLIKDGLAYKEFQKSSSPSWSKDGQKLVFLTEIFGQPEIAIWEKDKSGIQRFSISSGQNQTPSFSPDGNWIIFNASKGLESNIYIRHCDNTFATRISRMKDMAFYHATWSPDGKIYAIGKKDSKNYIFQFQTESKMFQVNIKGEPGPRLDTSSPIKRAEQEIKESL